eukprot:Transcript_26238.p1 GENE.Transcript_26238~~Transcript_26238.p1  ORF type:complete len:251 (+),score=61.15 Transcript_26238:118-870(+)
MNRVQTVVVGAGVVGLAVARALARAGREVLVLEATPSIGSVTSSRNSGVIHAGIYYDAGSLKARACVDGRRELYRFCEAHGVAHRRCGKLIVATEASQLATLESLRRKAAANGVTGEDELRVLTAADVATLEPEVRCVGGLLSPSTGIVDAHELMLALQAEAEAHGATVALNAPVVGGSVLSGGGLPAERLQRGQLRGLSGDDELAAPAVRHAVRLAKPVQLAPAINTGAGLEAACVVVDAGVDDARVAG